MATATLTWTPGGGITSTNQRVSYKLSVDTYWTDITPLLAPLDTTIQIPGLANNRLYNFQVQNICGTDACTEQSDVVTLALLVCPEDVSVSHTDTTVTATFTHLGGDVTNYQIALSDAATNVVVANHAITAPIPATITDTFTGLIPQKDYILQITLFCGVQDKGCGGILVTTDATSEPPCPEIAPGTITAVITKT